MMNSTDETDSILSHCSLETEFGSFQSNKSPINRDKSFDYEPDEMRFD